MSKTVINVQKDFLVLPVGVYSEPKTVKIFSGETLLDDIRIRLDYINPQYNAYYPIKAYKGKQIILEADNIDIKDFETDEPDYTSADNYAFRPYIHFTPRFGWINDPNGLVEYTSPVTGEKTYHLFFQHNPYDTVWNNLHWGHAVSRDLVNWKQLPEALCQDDNGTMFSGSAIVDKNNLTGLKDGGEDVILLYYTCAGDESLRSKDKPFTQCLAYSTDGGMSFKKYEKNPLIPNVMGQNRDPKVIWCDKLNSYIMAFYLAESVFTIYASKDLLNWEKLQNITLDGDAECPDLFPLYVNGDRNNAKWVLMGASQKYIVLECSEKGFNIIQNARPLEYGDASYAPQTFSGVSDGRCISMAWSRGITFPAPCPFCSQLSIPFVRTLKKQGGEYYLCSEPAEEIKLLYQGEVLHKCIVTDENTPFETELEKSAYDIELVLPEIPSGKIQLDIFGCAVEIDGKKNSVSVKKYTHAFHRSVTSVQSFPLSVAGDSIALRIIIDKCSLELVSSGGAAVMSTRAVCDYNLSRLKISCDKKTVIKELSIRTLKEADYN